jgi:hypothetical protein
MLGVSDILLGGETLYSPNADRRQSRACGSIDIRMQKVDIQS